MQNITGKRQFALLARGFAALCAALILAAPADALAAPTENVLYAFQGGNDGYGPSTGALIADRQGALYGTTDIGGNSCYEDSAGCGTIFKLTPPAPGQTAWSETVLYRFCSQQGCSDGALPYGGLIADSQGNLYGTTERGGSGNGIYGYGTVFKLSPPGRSQTAWTETVLYGFTGGTDGDTPVAGLIFDEQGALYGTTLYGGNSSVNGYGGGTVFKLTPPGDGQTAWTEAVLHRFHSVCTDGALPEAGLIIDEQGALYGTTSQGGSRCSGALSGNGTVFKLAPPGSGQTAWTEAVLYAFQGYPTDGALPGAGLIIDERGGEQRRSSIFNNDRDIPGALYGTTSWGGTGCGTQGGVDCGTVFKLTPPGNGQTAWTETVLHNFMAGSDGADPSAALIGDNQGALYGTTGTRWDR